MNYIAISLNNTIRPAGFMTTDDIELLIHHYCPADKRDVVNTSDVFFAPQDLAWRTDTGEGSES